MNFLLPIIENIKPLDEEWFKFAEAKQQQLTKPPGSLGRLEEIACRLSAIQKTLHPTVEKRRIVIFAADHGVASEGVSAYPSEVTAQMVANFYSGGAAINAISKTVNAELHVVDIGVASNIPIGNIEDNSNIRLINHKIRSGTNNMTYGPAMTESDLCMSLQTGLEIAQQAKEDGVTLIGLGEMGIGNTTAATAITAALTDLPPNQITGRGTGADDTTYKRKIEVIERSLKVNSPNKNDGLDVLRKVGGLEIAGLCGLCLGAAASGIAIVTDGFIATSAAAIAVRVCPTLASYIFASHLSQEPGHAALLNLIGLEPLLDLKMRLGEGTGAALAVGIIAASVAVFNEMATFKDAGVKDSEKILPA
jgi:nicotinate-nucleotide--dimethylbenzimidazole phosphoribosyltransferase